MMSVCIPIDMPQNCHMCPLLKHIEADDDHPSFFFCALDHWKESCTPEFLMTAEETMQRRHPTCKLTPSYKDVPPYDYVNRYDMFRYLNDHPDATGDELRRILRDVPSGDVVRILRAEWEEVGTGRDAIYRCSKCLHIGPYSRSGERCRSLYCQGCGAKMEGLYE